MTLAAGRLPLAAAAATLTALASLLAVSAPPSSAASAAAAEPASSRVLVRALPGHGSAAAAAVEAVGGTVLRDLPIVDGVSASVPAGAVDDLSRSRSVAAVTPDAAVQLTDASYDDSAVASSYGDSSGARGAWAAGATGAGVTVAVLDTGVTPVPDLAGRVVAGPDFSGERNSTRDSYGHGTVMAGIVAGNGASSRGRQGGAYVGMAPQAKVLSVKVAGRHGATDVSTVLAALQWITSSAPQYGTRVVNLSWGTPSKQSAVVDPLNYAVQRVWRKGIVVVAAAGNSGPKDGTINKPADDPMVISVGAYDDRHDTLPANDRVTDWSSRGPTVDGVAKPDVVAPGRTLVSTVDPRSLVAQQNADSLVAPGYIVGSGSSQAAAVTSGAAALLLSQRPSLTPDQVKAALRSTAVKIGDVAGTAQGRGRVAVDAALQAQPSASVQNGKATGLGSLEASRGGVHMQTTCPGSSEPRAITGEMDALCRPWNGVTWTGVTWTGDTWTGVTWTGDTWTGDTWTADTWTGDTWTGDTWTGVTWTGDTWTGDTWTGDTWTGDSWMSAFWGDKTPSWRPLPGEKAKAKDTRGSR